MTRWKAARAALSLHHRRPGGDKKGQTGIGDAPPKPTGPLDAADDKLDKATDNIGKKKKDGPFSKK